MEFLEKHKYHYTYILNFKKLHILSFFMHSLFIKLMLSINFCILSKNALESTQLSLSAKLWACKYLPEVIFFPLESK